MAYNNTVTSRQPSIIHNVVTSATNSRFSDISTAQYQPSPQYHITAAIIIITSSLTLFSIGVFPGVSATLSHRQLVMKAEPYYLYHTSYEY